MYRITKQISFCYGHRLLRYEGKCRHLHGHNGLVEVDLVAEELDERGMVVDFGDVQRIVKDWLERELDHKMILCREDPAVPLLQELGEALFVMDENPTAENIAKLIFFYAESHQLPVKEVRLWETPTSYAAFSRG